MYSYYSTQNIKQVATYQNQYDEDSPPPPPPPPPPPLSLPIDDNDFDLSVSILDLAKGDLYDSPSQNEYSNGQHLPSSQNIVYTGHSKTTVYNRNIPIITSNHNNPDILVKEVRSDHSPITRPARIKVEDRLQQYGKQIELKRSIKLKERDNNIKNESKLNLIASHSLPNRYDYDSGGGGGGGSVSGNSDYNDYDNNIDSSMDGISIVPRDIYTGQKLFEPQINSMSEKMVSRTRDPSIPIEEILHSKGMEYQIRAKLREEKQRKYSVKQREISKINHISEKIVKEKELLYGETSQDRLHRPIGEVKPYVLDTIDKPSFKPKINKKSEEIVQNCFGHLYNNPPVTHTSHSIEPSNVFYADTTSPLSSSSSSSYSYVLPSFRYSHHDDHDHDNDQLQAVELMDSNRSFCEIKDGVYTLAPSAASVTLSPSNSTIYSEDLKSLGVLGISAQHDPVTAVHIRSEVWMKERARRLERERIEREKELEKECSFKPKLKENKSFVSSLASNVLKYSNASNIADRQIEWKKKKEERLERERKKKEEHELDGYTFQPQISKIPDFIHSTKNKNSSISSSLDSRIDELFALTESEQYLPTRIKGGDYLWNQPSPLSSSSSSSSSSSKIPIRTQPIPQLSSTIIQDNKPTVTIEDRITMMLNGWEDDVDDRRSAKISLSNWNKVNDITNDNKNNRHSNKSSRSHPNFSNHRDPLRDYEMK